MTLQFRRSLEELLLEWCPANGMAALLLEHPTPGIYFPLVVKPFSVGTDYYSLPLRFKTDACRDIKLHEDSSPVELAYRGRLELTQPDLRLPVNQELLTLQGNGGSDLKVILLRSSPGSLPALGTAHLATLNRLVPLACTNWIEHAQNLLGVSDVRSLETLAKDVVKLLSDEEQDPPYFPILHAEVSVDPDDPLQRYSSANLLSWNCFLLDDRQAMPPYIPEMPGVMQKENVSTWWDDVTLRGDFRSMPESIRTASARTIDQVSVLGHARHDGCSWWAFARHDKDRRRMDGLLTGDGPARAIRPAGRPAQSVETLSPADLVRRALTVKAEEDDVLMTTWLVSEKGAALNVGFRAGRLIQVLDHAEVSDRHPVEVNDFAPFRVRLSPLPEVDRALIIQRVKPVLASAARAARQIDQAGLIEKSLDPVRQDLHQGSWHIDHPGGGLFVAGYHDVADWPEEALARCHPRMVTLLDDLLGQWTGREGACPESSCSGRAGCWHIRALKALAHDRLHASLLLAIVSGPLDDPSFLSADRELCLEEGGHWPEVLAALQTVITQGNRFRFEQCFHGRDDTLILRFSGQLNEAGVAAALTGKPDHQQRKGSFTRACSTLRRSASRFSVEVTHDEPESEGWGLVVVFSEKGLAC